MPPAGTASLASCRWVVLVLLHPRQRPFPLHPSGDSPSVISLLLLAPICLHRLHRRAGPLLHPVVTSPCSSSSYCRIGDRGFSRTNSREACCSECGPAGSTDSCSKARVPTNHDKQNSIAEHSNQTIMNIVGPMLTTAMLTASLWAEAVCHANWIQNRIYSKVVGGVLYTLWSGQKVRMNNIKTFGTVLTEASMPAITQISTSPETLDSTPSVTGSAQKTLGMHFCADALDARCTQMRNRSSRWLLTDFAEINQKELIRPISQVAP
ncbi:uncharacterized protein UHOD_11130 [Ustilago sp. UG-2017b]|nr:uncharacterized protein UHOD_11130 [Ustilago sp. UG-2017b]